MGNVKMPLGFRSQADVALHNGPFRFSRPAAQPQAESRWAGVHTGVTGHACIFGVLHHWNIDLSGGGQRLTHGLLFQDGLSVIRYSHSSSTLQRSKICELLAQAADGCGGDWKNV